MNDDDPGLNVPNWILTLGVLLTVAAGIGIGALTSYGSPTATVLLSIVGGVFLVGAVAGVLVARHEARTNSMTFRQVTFRTLKGGLQFLSGLLP